MISYSFHPTIKFTADWSREEINLLEINVRLRNSELETELYIKPTDTHQCLDSTSCHPYHYKKSIAYSQALRYDRICSGDEKFDQRCNDAEEWLMERDYSEILVRTQIFKARGESRDSILQWENIRTFESKLLTLLNTQLFRISEAYCRNFKFCYHIIKSIKRFLQRFR